MIERPMRKTEIIVSIILFQLLSEGHASIQCGVRDPNEPLQSRNFMSGRGTRWPNSTVPYVLDSGLHYYTHIILGAMKHIEHNTCIKFVQKTNEKHYLKIGTNKRGYDCYSHVGFSKLRENWIHLRAPYCMQNGIVIHELLHSLGFDHEHNRYDRDDYIRINWQNIMPGGNFNFFKSKKKGDYSEKPLCGTQSMDFSKCYNGYSFETFGYKYDYGSIMHYGRTAFGMYGRTTMTPIIHTNQELGQKVGLSQLDIKKLNAAYCEGKALEEPCVDSAENCPGWKQSCPTTPHVRNMCEKSCEVCKVGEFTIPRP